MAKGTTIIQGALDLIGVLQAGQTIDGNDLADGYRRMQNMMGQLGIQSLTAPSVGREVFDLVAGKGSTTNPYTIGPTGDLVTSRPNGLVNAGLLLGQSTPPYSTELPRTLYTDDAYESIQIKDLSNSLFTGVYFSATSPNATIGLWPVPDNALNKLVIYRLDQLGPFQSLTAEYVLPVGWDEMLEAQLAIRLAIPYKRQVTPELREMAVMSLANVKRANYKDNDIATDPALTTNGRGGYNINTGNM